MDNETETIYLAWRNTTEDTDTSEERFEELYIGGFYSSEALAEAVLEDTGDVESFWQDRSNHYLASYYKFDYEGFGRDLELGGDVYSIDQAGLKHYFWNNH